MLITALARRVVPLGLIAATLVFVPDLPAPDEPRGTGSASSSETLKTLLESLSVKQAALAEARDKRTDATESQRAGIEAEIRQHQAEVDELQRKFETIASGVDSSELSDPSQQTFDLQHELVTLMRPLVQQLKEVTEEPRQIEQLRNQVALSERRLQLTKRALAGIQRSIEQATDPELITELGKTLELWKSREIDFSNRKQVASFELKNKLEARKSLVESTGSFLDKFFRSRGFNLLVAFSAFFGVFFLLRVVRHRVLTIVFRRRASFYARLSSVVLEILTFLMAILAMVMALFTVSDWVLLVLVLIFLVGLGWASINMLPQFFEQVRLLLNLGSVRENERVILDGLPWRVDRLKVYTVLRNPDLTGGEYRIPVQYLVGLHSRPLGKNEIWFPCREGDWVILSDGTRGRVSLQSPDLVQLIEPGGARRTYLTKAFLNTSPRNLSTNYRVQTTFGIDYAHQAISTTEVPQLMEERLRDDLLRIIEPEELLSLTVEFKAAGPSSLDYQVLLDVAGSAAGKYEELQRALSRILVDACNEHGWTIPFTQVTLHEAG